MASLSLTNCCFLPRLTGPKSSLDPRLRCENFPFPVPPRYLLSHRSGRRCSALSPSESLVTDSVPSESGTYKVGDFMTKKQNLHVVKPTTTVDEALEALVEKRITGFPVIDDDWNLVGVVSDYDLLALDSISGGSQNDVNMFPDVNSSWKPSCHDYLDLLSRELNQHSVILRVNRLHCVLILLTSILCVHLFFDARP
ncbi:CBS domain-containing protein CBSX2, chloroplastic-like isoform X2 [Tripterygium wilfordii]|uniref:CBS domain-containing protein CBSX2, chloroplastic-like isoform X2 n=1 Tax=Tripterygium wilfordii TaxID=458696 RepID=UPI0018F82B46|nr:CBS domain-containing protein CBSX2, chloroplastic-like isoform X2 [Tripterygium wilfordii]